jgi:hypothetical protein
MGIKVVGRSKGVSPFRDEELSRRDIEIRDLTEQVHELEKQLKNKTKQEVAGTRRKAMKSFFKKTSVIAALIVVSIVSYVFMIGFSSGYLAKNCIAEQALRSEDKREDCGGYYAAAAIWPISLPCVYGARLGD